MKKLHVFSVLLVCFIIHLISTNSFAQVKPPKSSQEVPDMPTTNIIGGASTTINTVPWQILLEVNGADACGGTIIAPGWILTAAHCLENSTGTRYQASQLRIYAGITNRSQKNTGQVRTITQIIRHPNYVNTAGGNDIALLRLSSPLAFNANVQGIRYATADDANAGLNNPGRIGLISGWGWTNNTGARPDALQRVTLPIISNADATSRGSNVNGTMIALAQNGIAAAPGDSGGPMVVNGILAGASSWGFFPKEQNPTIYTRVSNYCDWISDNIAAIENGGDVACSASTTFNLRHHPFGANVTWTATPANRFVTSSGTGTTASLRTTTSSNGTGTLTFTINGGCGTTTVSRTISYGAPVSTTLSPSSVQFYPGTTTTINASPAVSSWSVSSGLTIVSQNNTRIIVSGNTPGNYSVVGTRTNSCGTSTRTASVKILQNSSPPPGGCEPNCPVNPIVVYPNPVDEVLTIESAGSNNLSSTEAVNPTSAMVTNHLTATGVGAQSSFSVKLYDSRQYVMREATSG